MQYINDGQDCISLLRFALMYQDYLMYDWRLYPLHGTGVLLHLSCILLLPFETCFSCNTDMFNKKCSVKKKFSCWAYLHNDAFLHLTNTSQSKGAHSHYNTYVMCNVEKQRHAAFFCRTSNDTTGHHSTSHCTALQRLECSVHLYTLNKGKKV